MLTHSQFPRKIKHERRTRLKSWRQPLYARGRGRYLLNVDWGHLLPASASPAAASTTAGRFNFWLAVEFSAGCFDFSSSNFPPAASLQRHFFLAVLSFGPGGRTSQPQPSRGPAGHSESQAPLLLRHRRRRSESRRRHGPEEKMTSSPAIHSLELLHRKEEEAVWEPQPLCQEGAAASRRGRTSAAAW